MKNKNVILGFTGGIGRSTAKALLESGEETIAIARNISKAEKYKNDLTGLPLVEGDIYNIQFMDTILRDAKNLFYCVNIPYPDWYTQAREMLKIAVDLCKKHNVKIIFPGNVYIYGYAQYNPVDEKHPHDAHTRKGKIRIEMEDMLKKAEGLQFTIIRMPDFYGPYVINGVTDKLFLNALNGKSLLWYGDLDIEYETIFIEDAGRAFVKAGLSDLSSGEEYNLSASSVIEPREFAAEISRQGGKNSKIKQMNSDLFFGIVSLFNKTAYEFKEMLYLRRSKLILSNAKYLQTFGEYRINDYKSGIAKTFEWIKNWKY